MATFIGLALVAGAIVGGFLGLLAWRGFAAAAEARAAERVLVAIPAGTAARLGGGGTGAGGGASGTAGAATAGLPPSALRLTAGDTLVLRNDDTQTHEVGAYTIAPGAILELTVDAADAGTFRCSFSAAGSFDLDVAPPLQPLTLILPAVLIGMPVGGIIGIVGWIARSIGEPEASHV